MKKRVTNGLLTILFSILLIVLGVAVWGNFSKDKDVALVPTITLAPAPSEISIATPTPEPPATLSPDELFASEGDNVQGISLAVAGDIVCHTALNFEAKQDGDDNYDFTKIFGGASGYLLNADYAVATLETTFPNTSEYAGYPLFKSPESLARNLADLGIDLLNTATNHSMDSELAGLQRTLDILDENRIAHVGTYRNQEEKNADNGIKVVDVNGISIAFLSFTYSAGEIPITGSEYAVNVFYKDEATIDYDKIEADLSAAKALNPDIIAVFMHWGDDFSKKPSSLQVELSDFIFKEGADIILGGHTHVAKQLEMRQIINSDGTERTGFICYSLGNFVSAQDRDLTNLTAILNIIIEKNHTTGASRVKSVGYAPMFMVRLPDDYLTEAGWRYRLWDLHTAINSYEAGDNLGVINEELYSDLKIGLENIHALLGKDMDIYR